MTDYEAPALRSPVEGGSEALMAFAKALAAIENVAKTQTADTGKYKYRYADLGDVLDEVKRVCSDFGLAVTQNGTCDPNGMLAVSTTIIHSDSGQWVSFPSMMLRMPQDAQALGSALTYLRRYALLTIFGIAPDDDDGREATRVARQSGDGYRSEAERLIHEILGDMNPEDARALRAEFREEFRMGLSDLPVGKHGDALTWVRVWRPPVDSPADDAAADGEVSGAVEPATP